MTRSERPPRRTIGRLAADLGISVETIRFYERRGLVRQPTRRAGAFRHYGDDVAATIRYIRLAQDLGLSLKEIEQLKEKLESGPAFCTTLRETVRRRRDHIDAEIAALERLRGELTAFLDRRTSRDSSLPCPIVSELKNLECAVVQTLPPTETN